MTTWTKETLQDDTWNVTQPGAVIRITEDGVVRITETVTEVRIVQRGGLNPWSNETAPSGAWTKE